MEDIGGCRRRHAQYEAAKYGLRPQFVRSIPKDDPLIKSIYDQKSNHRWRKRPMTPAEISCYWGHRSAWQIVACDIAPFRLILEDDFEFSRPADLHYLAERVCPSIPDWDIIILAPHLPNGKYRTLLSETFELRDYRYGATGAVGYLLTPDGARKLLTRPRVFRPLDEDFINPWELNLRILTVSPPLIREYRQGISLIESERRKRKRNLIRSVYGGMLKLRWKLLSHYHWQRRTWL